MEIEDLSLEELVRLHRKVCRRIRELQRAKVSEKLQDFQIGDKVSFQHEGNTVTGTVIRGNRKSLSVRTDRVHWYLDPRSATKIAICSWKELVLRYKLQSLGPGTKKTKKQESLTSAGLMVTCGFLPTRDPYCTRLFTSARSLTSFSRSQIAWMPASRRARSSSAMSVGGFECLVPLILSLTHIFSGNPGYFPRGQESKATLSRSVEPRPRCDTLVRDRNVIPLVSNKPVSCVIIEEMTFLCPSVCLRSSCSTRDSTDLESSRSARRMATILAADPPTSVALPCPSYVSIL